MDQAKLRQLIMHIMLLVGPLRQDRLKALTEMVLVACDDDIDQALGLVTAIIHKYGDNSTGLT